MRYASPTTSKEAATLIARAKGQAVVLAGGTDLLVRMKSGFVEPDLIVDIKRIPATRQSGHIIAICAPRGIKSGTNTTVISDQENFFML